MLMSVRALEYVGQGVCVWTQTAHTGVSVCPDSVLQVLDVSAEVRDKGLWEFTGHWHEQFVPCNLNLNPSITWFCHCNLAVEMNVGFLFVCFFFFGVTDINECLEAEFCFPRGECVNTEGSYMCVCAQGYNTNVNGTLCHGTCSVCVYCCAWACADI